MTYVISLKRYEEADNRKYLLNYTLQNNSIFVLISYFPLVYLHAFKWNQCLQVLGQFTAQFIDLLEDVFDVADSPTECFMGFPDSQRSEATWLLSIAAHQVCTTHSAAA